jgi:hypothetical protein
MADTRNKLQILMNVARGHETRTRQAYSVLGQSGLGIQRMDCVGEEARALVLLDMIGDLCKAAEKFTKAIDVALFMLECQSLESNYRSIPHQN